MVKFSPLRFHGTWPQCGHGSGGGGTSRGEGMSC